VFTGINLLGVRWLAETNRIAVLWNIAIPVLTVIVLVFVVFRPSNFGIGVISRPRTVRRCDDHSRVVRPGPRRPVVPDHLLRVDPNGDGAELVAEQVRGEEQEATAAGTA